jgi:hypothetical protein
MRTGAGQSEMEEEMSEWKVRQPDCGQDWDLVPDKYVLFEDHRTVATEWWEQTFPYRDYQADGILEVMSPSGEVKRFEMGIESIPHAYAEELDQ